MRKIKGFKMMMGDSLKDCTPEQILDMSVGGGGYGKVASETTLDGESIQTFRLPKNIMFNYDPDSTIMSFRFEEPQNFDDLPNDLTKEDGIVVGKNNFELIYEK